MKDKAAQQITDTIKLKHHSTNIPTITPAEKITKAVNNITSAIQNQPTKGPPDILKWYNGYVQYS